ncbi:protein hu-li tai shao-like isoform X2 [Amphibalanus amphitrite]|uniref:protein hu-li tai shao-like isoform X2 n=1 Tax=Amphibalanus amphitrite TaxID=1232801 RepID=UPI001C912F39|nr:protein hu-li tai shao-like isoform X2 [Amphibalanus amphitrite]XP_043224583.1 protein hu-li tai shao-like isoform X2 [Amphibalanus amphitrite]
METATATANGGAGDAPDTNGLSEEELERQRMRPADVDADMREMSRRKRVEAVLQSPAFRMELDRLVEAGMTQGNCVGGSTLSDMLGLVRAGPVTGRAGMQCVQPIADLRGAEAAQLTKPEKMLRCKLASLLRVMDMFGWAQGVCNHATVRLSQDLEHFLVNPYGLLYGEITAASLLKADMQGNIVAAGSSGLGLNSAAYAQHAAIHAARPDLRVVLHVQEPAVVTVSALRAGLLPLTEHACVLGEVSVHRLPADGADPEHQRLTRDLGVHNKVMLLQNRGALCCGENIEEAFFLLSHLVAACKNQVVMMPLGVDNLTLVDEAQRQLVFEESRRPPTRPTLSSSGEERPSPRSQWRLGELEFEALMRVMDNAGYRTGHIYRHTMRAEAPAHQSDVEYPPAASSYLADIDDVFKYSPMRKTRPGERTRWLNTPNVYQKVEMLETGTNDPKTIYKWVPDGSPSHGNTPIKVDAALQFVPKNTNPKEFKQLQQQIKENRRGGGVSAGPQSHILEGVSWDEARQLQEAAEQRAGGDQVVLVGAASKGIIQRNYQHNATVYKTPYAKNPFDQVTDEDLEEYKRFVDQKSRGASVEAEVPAPVTEAPQHAERVQLPSDGEEADVSRSSAPGDVSAAPAPAPAAAAAAATAGRVDSPPFSPSDHEEGEPESPRSAGRPGSQPPVSPVSPAGTGSPASPRGLAGTHFPMPLAENPRVKPVPPVRAPTAPAPAPAPRSGTAQRDLTANGDETDTGHMSTVSHTDQEDISTSEASKKDKKKKKGLRTPSFLKKKKDKKKDKKEEASK